MGFGIKGKNVLALGGGYVKKSHPLQFNTLKRDFIVYI